MIGNNNLLITNRDLHLLKELGIARVLDREQVKIVAGFKSTSTVNARLLKLHDAGVLTRFFIGTAAGGMKALYSLSTKGAHVAEVHARPIQRKADSVLVGDIFVEHQLATNEVWLSAKYRSNSDVAFIRWLTFPTVLSKSIPLIPDGYFEVRTASGIQCMFCEVDRGTESLRVWSKKIELYLALAASGEFLKQFNQPKFRVLIACPSELRMNGIRKTVKKYTNKIFRFSTLESINREGLFASIWNLPEGSEQQSLV